MASSTVTNAKYLDYAGLSTLVINIKTLVDNKIIDAKQVLGGRLGKALTATEVQVGLHTPSGFTVNGSDVTELSSITIPGATTAAAGVMTAADKTKLNGIAAGAQVNQKAFSIVNANGTNLTSTSATDTLTIIQGNGISITPSSNGRAFSIANTYKYTHPDYATSSTSSTSALSSGSKFTTLTGLEYHDDGHLKTIISKEFTLPTLINKIQFSDDGVSEVPNRDTVSVVKAFSTATNIAGQSTATIEYYSVTLPTQKYVDNAIKDKIAEADALIYKGLKTATTGNKIILETDAKCGYLYKAATSGYVCIKGTTDNGAHVEPGDMIIANTDSPTTLAGWDIIERNIDGAVSGPASSTDGYVAVFNGSTGKIIKQGVALTSLSTSGHTHNITANGSGDSEITVNKSNGNLAVTYNISHATHMTSIFGGTATSATADAWGESVTVKVPRLDINTYGHVTAVNEVDYKISIPAKPTHPALDLDTYWGDGTDSHDAYDPDNSTGQSWKIYKGIKSISAGTNIGVSTTNGVATITCSYTYSLPAAATNALGGVKIYGKRTGDISATYGLTTAGRYYGVELDKSNRAFVNVPWTDTKVQSTTVSGGTHYLLGSDNKSNETDYAYKRDNVYITDDEVLACAPSTVITSTASKVITHSDAITVAMINALFA